MLKVEIIIKVGLHPIHCRSILHGMCTVHFVSFHLIIVVSSCTDQYTNFTMNTVDYLLQNRFSSHKVH